MVPPSSHGVSRVPRYSGSCRFCANFGYGALTLSGRLSQNRSPVLAEYLTQSETPACTHAGLGSSRFARRYFGNRCFFLFLRVLRCFSSPGALLWSYLIHSMMMGHDSHRVSPFRNLRINACLRLLVAYRSLPRLSSAYGALASTLCSCKLDFLVARFVSIILRELKIDFQSRLHLCNP